MTTEDKALAIRPSDTDAITTMLNAAIDKGISPEGLEKLTDTYLKMQARQAEREFVEALLAFQAECPAIAKDTEGVHRKKYAPLAKIITAIAPVLMKHGLSYRFDSVLTDRGVTSTCTVSHMGGHSVQATFAAPIEPSPGMSKMHGTASAVSFSQRYALQQALGIVPGQGDDDGIAATRGTLLNEAQVIELQKLLDVVQPDMDKFWKYVGAGVTKLEEIAAYDFERIRAALQRMNQAKREANSDPR